MNEALRQGLIRTLPYAQHLTTALRPLAPGNFQNYLEQTLTNSFPILSKDPQYVTPSDFLDSGIGVMPLGITGKAYKTVSEGLSELNLPRFKLNKKTGQFIGGPPGLDSPEKLQRLIDAYKTRVKKALEWVDPGYFYAKGEEAIKEVARDPYEARKMAKMLAATSSQATPQLNTAFTVQGMNQGSAGIPINTGISTDRSLLNAIYSGDDVYTGHKTHQFGEAFFEHKNPKAMAPNDRWEFRGMGFKKDGGTAQNHAFINHVRAEATKQFNLEHGTKFTPIELQELHWAQIRKEGGISLKPGDTLENALRNQIIQHGRESAPGSTARHLKGLRPDDAQAYHEQLKNIFIDPATGKDRLIDAMGGMQFPALDSPGVYGGMVTPGWQGRSLGYRTAKGMDPTDIARLRATESIYGLMAGQDMGAATMMNGLAKVNPKTATGAIMKMPGQITPEQAKGLISQLEGKLGHNDFFPMAMEEGGGLVNFGGGNLTQALNELDLKKILGGPVTTKPTNPATVAVKLPWARGKATAKMLSTLKSSANPNLERMADSPEVRQLAGNVANLYVKMRDKLPNEKIINVLTAWSKGGIHAVEELVKKGLAPAVALSILAEHENDSEN